MAANPTADVLVVGAGPVGLTMAAELARHGLSCRIVDKSPAPSDKSKALVVWSRSLEMLEDMGAVAPFLEAGMAVHGASIYAGTRRLVHLTFEIDSPYDYGLMLPQCETERLLAAHLERFDLRVERAVELVALAPEADAVRAVLRPAGGREEESRFAWAVGCDGAHSAVRHQLAAEFSGEAEPNDWLLADVRVHGPVVEDEVTIYFHDRGVLLFFPIEPGRFRIVADVGLAPAVEKPADPTLAEVQRVVDERGPGGIALADAVWLAGFRIHERKVARFRHGRAFLAGDAAHIHSPAGGQGMNIGMQDAYNLAWKMALVHRGRAHDVLLDSYDAERAAVAEQVLRNAGAMTRAATLRNPVARQLRNRFYALLGSLDIVQEKIGDTISQLAFRYRESPITGEHRGRAAHAWLLGGGVRAGDRMPDAELVEAATGAPRRVFEVTAGTRHTLLLLTGVEAPAAQIAPLARIADAARARFGDLLGIVTVAAAEDDDSPSVAGALRDPAELLHRRLGAASPTLYLVRPDGYVGFRSQPAEAASLIAHLERYLV